MATLLLLSVTAILYTLTFIHAQNKEEPSKHFNKNRLLTMYSEVDDEYFDDSLSELTEKEINRLCHGTLFGYRRVQRRRFNGGRWNVLVRRRHHVTTSTVPSTLKPTTDTNLIMKQ